MASNRTDALLIARRYATAIFTQAVAAKTEGEVVAEFSALAEAITGDAALRAALINPLISREVKANILGALIAKGEALTQRSVAVLAAGGRAELLPQVAELLRAALSAHKGELVAVVTSARPLSAAVQKQLKDALAKATGKAVEMQLTENPALLGGLSVQLGSLKLDATLAGALSTMRAQMTAPASTTF